MDKFTLTITLGNDAMTEPEHVAEALNTVAGKLRSGYEEGVIMDANGAKVGKWEIV